MVIFGAPKYSSAESDRRPTLDFWWRQIIFFVSKCRRICQHPRLYLKWPAYNWVNLIFYYFLITENISSFFFIYFTYRVCNLNFNHFKCYFLDTRIRTILMLPRKLTSDQALLGRASSLEKYGLRVMTLRVKATSERVPRRCQSDQE